MKIAFFEATEQDQQATKQLLAEAKLDAAGVIFFAEKLDTDNISKIKDVEVISVFINSVINKELIDALPNLKLINTSSTGYDHIDVKYAASKNIAVTNVPAYGSRTVAEFTFALILGLSRKAFAAYRQVKDNHGFSIADFQGFNLQGKTLGIVGTGRIGQNVAQIARGFDMKVVAFDAFPNPAKAKELQFEYVALDELLSQADVVTLHVPYNKDTHHLINKTNITKFKKGALLINTSRGEVADTEALLMGLKQGILTGAGLDVIEGERDLKDEWHLLSDYRRHEQDIKTLMEDHVLMDLPQVALTPHIAFFTAEAKREILQTTVSNISGFLQNKPLNAIKPA